MAKAAVDTNVIVSGLLGKGNPRKIWQAFKRGEFTLVLSPLMFEEIVSVLPRPKFRNLIDNRDREEVVLFLESFAEFIVPTKLVSVCRDSEDNHILACALESQVDFIVSGDKDLLCLGSFQNIPIITPKDFLTRLKKL